MRVLYHHRTLKTDAQGIHVDRIIAALRRQGHEVQEVALVGQGGTGGDAERRGGWGLVSRLGRIGPLREMMELGYNVYAWPRLRGAAQAFGPDLIYERYSLHTLVGGRVARSLDVPFIVEVNAPLARERQETEGLWFSRLALRNERRCLQRADVVIAVTTPLKEILVAEGVDAERIVVMPNGVDLPEETGAAAPDPSEIATFRSRFGLTGGSLVVGFVGFVRPWHCVDMLLKAVDSEELVREADPRVLIVGDGPALPMLRERAAQGVLPGRVVFTGALAARDVEIALRTMDVTVQPAATEYACPIKLVEYMAAGRAIVAPCQPNVIELVGEGGPAEAAPEPVAALFTPQDALDLRRVLRRVLLDADLRESLGRAAGRRLRSRGLTWDQNARRVIDLVERIRRGS